MTPNGLAMRAQTDGQTDGQMDATKCIISLALRSIITSVIGNESYKSVLNGYLISTHFDGDEW